MARESLQQNNDNDVVTSVKKQKLLNKFRSFKRIGRNFNKRLSGRSSSETLLSIKRNNKDLAKALSQSQIEGQEWKTEALNSRAVNQELRAVIQRYEGSNFQEIVQWHLNNELETIRNGYHILFQKAVSALGTSAGCISDMKDLLARQGNVQINGTFNGGNGTFSNKSSSLRSPPQNRVFPMFMGHTMQKPVIKLRAISETDSRRYGLNHQARTNSVNEEPHQPLSELVPPSVDTIAEANESNQSESSHTNSINDHDEVVESSGSDSSSSDSSLTDNSQSERSTSDDIENSIQIRRLSPESCFNEVGYGASEELNLSDNSSGTSITVSPKNILSSKCKRKNNSKPTAMSIEFGKRVLVKNNDEELENDTEPKAGPSWLRKNRSRQSPKYHMELEFSGHDSDTECDPIPSIHKRKSMRRSKCTLNSQSNSNFRKTTNKALVKSTKNSKRKSFKKKIRSPDIFISNDATPQQNHFSIETADMEFSSPIFMQESGKSSEKTEEANSSLSKNHKSELNTSVELDSRVESVIIEDFDAIVSSGNKSKKIFISSKSLAEKLSAYKNNMNSDKNVIKSSSPIYSPVESRTPYDLSLIGLSMSMDESLSLNFGKENIPPELCSSNLSPSVVLNDISKRTSEIEVKNSWPNIEVDLSQLVNDSEEKSVKSQDVSVVLKDIRKSIADFSFDCSITVSPKKSTVNDSSRKSSSRKSNHFIGFQKTLLNYNCELDLQQVFSPSKIKTRNQKRKKSVLQNSTQTAPKKRTNHSVLSEGGSPPKKLKTKVSNKDKNSVIETCRSQENEVSSKNIKSRTLNNKNITNRKSKKASKTNQETTVTLGAITTIDKLENNKMSVIESKITDKQKSESKTVSKKTANKKITDTAKSFKGTKNKKTTAVINNKKKENENIATDNKTDEKENKMIANEALIKQINLGTHRKSVLRRSETNNFIEAGSQPVLEHNSTSENRKNCSSGVFVLPSNLEMPQISEKAVETCAVNDSINDFEDTYRRSFRARNVPSYKEPSLNEKLRSEAKGKSKKKR